MSAQYRPYRDEESVDGLETTAWSDHEPGTIQIYEKTTEELPFGANSKRTPWVLAVLFIFTGLLGFSLGYLAHQKEFTSTILDHEATDQMLSSFIHEDATIKDKLIHHIDGHNILSFLQQYNDTNRIPGSESDQDFALHIQELFKEYKFDSITATNFSFRTMLPKQPAVVSVLDQENKTLFSNLNLESYPHDDMRPFLPLSQSEATTIISNKIIYVNEGSKQDYAKFYDLTGLTNLDMKGKIFVIRQKFYNAHEVVINAQELGAEALLLFPDPDTYGSSSPFPRSIRLPNDAGRSHPTAWSGYGDLASFNMSSTGIDVSKLGLDKDAKVSIPVVLISYNTAYKILRGLNGPLVPRDWNCFDYTLRIGPGFRDDYDDKRASIKIESHNQETNISSTTVSGIISGSTEPDRYIVIGSRRDSLNRGLLDSISGTAVMMEIARAFGALLQQNWRPKRSIVFNSFGSESLNLIGSSHWLEDHQKLLHARAVVYLNCDLVVIGNQSASIAASPLLFQVIYNATKQISNPGAEKFSPLPSVYDVWKNTHHISNSQVGSGKLLDPELEKLLEESDAVEPKLTKFAQDETNAEIDGDDSMGQIGSILKEYKKSATIKTRPKIRPLDLQSIYSPFLLYAGIPVLDARYAGFEGSKPVDNQPHLLEDVFPLLGTKYDNLKAIQMIDPHLKYHVAIAQTLSEIVRDLSDSVFLPFNLLEYAVVLGDSYAHFESKFGSTINKTGIDLEQLKETIRDFTKAAIRFHHRQDQTPLKDPLKVRELNDQLMQLERNFLDSGGISGHFERKHIILSPNDGQDSHTGFPGIVDWIATLEGDDLEPSDHELFASILKVHYKLVIYTISNAIKVLDEVYII